MRIDKTLEGAEQRLSELVSRMADLEARVSRLPKGKEITRSSEEIRHGLATDRGRLTELGVELQRARAAVATITDVTVERW